VGHDSTIALSAAAAACTVILLLDLMLLLRLHAAAMYMLFVLLVVTMAVVIVLCRCRCRSAAAGIAARMSRNIISVSISGFFLETLRRVFLIQPLAGPMVGVRMTPDDGAERFRSRIQSWRL